MTTTKPRLHYFDVLKGIAIFMVVMGHVITICVRDIDRTTLFKFISEIHMPLFFFISGWFTYGVKNGKLKAPRLGARAKQLLLPMIVVSTLWIFYFPHSGLQSPFDSSFEGLWCSVGKNGYWFPLCLFEIIVVYALIRPLFGRIRGVFGSILFGTAIWVVLIAVAIVFDGTPIGEIAGLPMLATYWAPFFIGVIASRHRDGFMRLTQSPVATTLSLLVGGFALYYTCWFWEFPLPDCFVWISRGLLHIALAIVAIAVVAPWVNNEYAALQPGQQPGRWVRLWTYLGVNSLGIYLLHYFFLFPMGILRPTLEGLNVSFVPMFVLSAVVAAVVILITLGLMRIISVSKPLSTLLIGK